MAAARVVTKAELLGYLSYARLDIDEDKIADEVISFSRSQCNSWLVRRKISFAAIEELDDTLDLIWPASFSFGLELLSQRGQYQQSSGDVAKSRIGEMETQFQRWQPMFFFAKGMALGFYDLLPHMTYQMMAMQYIRSWVSWRFMQVRPTEVAWGTKVARLNNKSEDYYPNVMGEITGHHGRRSYE